MNTNAAMLSKIQYWAVPQHSNICQALPQGTHTASKCCSQSGELNLLFHRGFKGKQIDSVNIKTRQTHQGVFTLTNQAGKNRDSEKSDSSLTTSASHRQSDWEYLSNWMNEHPSEWAISISNNVQFLPQKTNNKLCKAWDFCPNFCQNSKKYEWFSVASFVFKYKVSVANMF